MTWEQTTKSITWCDCRARPYWDTVCSHEKPHKRGFYKSRVTRRCRRGWELDSYTVSVFRVGRPLSYLLPSHGVGLSRDFRRARAMELLVTQGNERINLGRVLRRNGCREKVQAARITAAKARRDGS